MATTLTLVTTATLSGSYVEASNTTSPNEGVNFSDNQSIVNGTGDNQSDLFFSVRGNHTSTVSYDLDAGTMLDRFGNALVFAEVRGILLVNLSTTATEILTLSGDFMLALGVGTGRTEVVGPGGKFDRTDPIDGLTVTAATQDTLTIDAGGNTIAYDLYIWGTSA